MSSQYAYPRPEYPRPDRQRGTIEGIDWLNLNGPWQFRFDGERRGVQEEWFQSSGAPWREQIIVPFCWESLAAWGEGEAAGNDNFYSTRVFRNPLEVNRSNHRSAARYEVGWYRRDVEIPNHSAWNGKRVILTIGAADFFTDCWCNGIPLGHHEGGYTPFEFDLTDALQTSPNGKRRATLVLRVEDPMDNHEQPVGKQWRWYTTVSGIWQTVFIEPRDATHIACFRIYPDTDQSEARFAIDCSNADDDCQVIAEITPPQGDLIRATIPVRAGGAEGKIPIRPLLLWNPNEPHLYWTKLHLQRNGETVDLVRTYFGMRKIDAGPVEDPHAPAALRLNGIARYLRGALYQSYYPEGVYTAGDVERMKNDILYAKEVGFNFLRVHIKVDDPLLLYYADTLGMLLMADFPNFGEGGDTPLGRRRFEWMMRKAINRDFNHPSIVAWCLFNETWGFGGQLSFLDAILEPEKAREQLRREREEREKQERESQRRGGVPEAVTGVTGTLMAEPSGGGAATAVATAAEVEKQKIANVASHAWVQTMWQLAKDLDPTRLIEDMSVVHWEHLDYYLHGDTDINSWHFYLNDYAKAKEHIDKVVGSTYPGSPFNYAQGFQHAGQPLINSEYGGVGALDGDRDVSWSFKFLTNELRRHGAIAAYIYTELHDVEWEFNGFLNYDRTPKDFGYDPRIINESDALPIDAPPVAQYALGERVQVDVGSSHYSTIRHENVTLRWRLAGNDTLGKVHQDLACGFAPIEFPHRRVAHAHTIQLEMPRVPMLCTLWVEAYKPDGVVVARNFIHLFAWNGYPAAREVVERGVVLRGRPSEWVSSVWNAPSGTREQDAEADACFGSGAGYFEWALPLEEVDVAKIRRLRVLCEASARRTDTPQTDDHRYPTSLSVSLNDVPVYYGVVADHPHDARGVLSYLRGGYGAYGYLIHATAEGEELREIIRHIGDGYLHLRCAVPTDALAQGGLVVYGAECGRYPVCPTVIVEM